VVSTTEAVIIPLRGNDEVDAKEELMAEEAVKA
jgi:hypothetical protein